MNWNLVKFKMCMFVEWLHKIPCYYGEHSPTYSLSHVSHCEYCFKPLKEKKKK